MTLRSRFALALSFQTLLAACSDPASPPVGESDSGITDAAVSDAAVDMELVDATTSLDMSLTDAGPLEDAAPHGDAGADFAQSYYKRSCGPADGPAFELALFNSAVAACTVDDTLLSLSFYVHDLSGAPVPPTAGSTIESTPEHSSGTANRCPEGTAECESSESWTLHFSSYTDSVGAVGTYSVTWLDGSVTSGQFNANWCSATLLCG